MKDIGLRPRLVVSTDGSGAVGHAGARLLADLAEAAGLTAAYSTVLRPLRARGTGHDLGRIAADLAVMLADGREAEPLLSIDGRRQHLARSRQHPPCRTDASTATLRKACSAAVGIAAGQDHEEGHPHTLRSLQSDRTAGPDVKEQPCTGNPPG
ncbi:hypothetical protein [Streptomyces sp. NBC_00893]|uniref:hypothetical protein n=1 Tax=Streptomyces sp. NBC_00893 TaxID=2975862 RepID=UPI0022578F8C|nr:hypothetical protein [Streptomyces sp. NBC_00893]MCX4851269.1 transposase [Streptomyces sp. NBC_00893]